MKRNLIVAVALALSVIAAGFAPPALANCQSVRHTFSSGPIKSSTSFPVLTTEFTGVWWQVGYGDTAIGPGNDSGSFPPGEVPYYVIGNECLYGQGCWLYITYYSREYYGVRMQGDWQEPRVDGCVDNVPGTACMAAAFSDQRNGQGHFALMSDAENALGDFQLRGTATTVLTPTPKPVPTVINDAGGVLTVDLAQIQAPLAGLFEDIAFGCPHAVKGFTIYQKTVPPGGTAPVDRRREGNPDVGSPPWDLTRGGAAGSSSDGTPIPWTDGAAVSVTPIGCIDGGSLALATSLEFDSGFKLRHLSGNSVLIPCGTCQAVDADGDGARTDKCATYAGFDCDPARPEVHPGAPQICDGLNNDCAHPRWPALDQTNEVDEDGDGISGCAGDPCPRDLLNDADADGFCADVDNCPALANPGQEDRDQDEQGDLCDPCPDSIFDDGDGDGLCGNIDDCPVTYNPGQLDTDQDGIGDPCDACPLDPDNDLDQDGRCGNVDVCPNDPANDADGDGICGDVDACPLDRDNDRDADTVCGDVDNCPADPNPGQGDVDGDDIGDACDLFAPPVAVGGYTTWAEYLAAGDLDGDGDEDIAATSGDQLDWYENLSGTGSSWSRHGLGTVSTLTFGSGRVVIADLDEDGKNDIVHLARVVSWFQKGGGPNFTQRTITTTGCGGNADTVDLDRDGDLDLVMADLCGTRALFLENTTGDAQTWAQRTIGTQSGLENTSVADVEGDGDIDVLMAGNAPGIAPNIVFLLRNDGAANFTQTMVASGPAGSHEGSPRSADVADLDGDGDPDLIVGLISDSIQIGYLQWYENRGPLATWPRRQIAALSQDSIYRLFAADIDRDGDPDLVINTGLIAWYENQGGGLLWELRIISTTGFKSTALAPGDLDADGDTDVLTGTYWTFIIEHHRNIGTIRPTARAGPDQTVPCASQAGAIVTLDGSASTHPGGLALTYTWTGPFPDVVTTSPPVRVLVPPGTHIVHLAVSDPTGAQDLDNLIVSVVEPSGGGGGVSLDPAELWPPNHRLVPVSATLTGTCAMGLALVSAVSSEPDDAPGGRDGMTTGDIAGASLGTPDTSLLLRAERDTSGPGRLYTIRWEVDDGAGGRRTLTGSAFVPVHPGGPADPIEVLAEEGIAGTTLYWSPLPAWFDVIRGDLSALSVSADAGGMLRAGPVTCLRAASPSPDTIGWEDPSVPPPGRSWFYLVESIDPATGERSGYGTEPAPLPVVVTSGDCP